MVSIERSWTETESRLESAPPVFALPSLLAIRPPVSAPCRRPRLAGHYPVRPAGHGQRQGGGGVGGDQQGGEDGQKELATHSPLD